MKKWTFKPLDQSVDIRQVASYNFAQLDKVSATITLEVRAFVDTTAASVTHTLPDGNQNSDKDYFYEKIDSSANTVSISPFPGQTINGSASAYVLSVQFDRVCLMWSAAMQGWLIR